jgi:replicative DNA helicase
MMHEIICGISTAFHNKDNLAPLKPRKNKETGETEQSNRWAFGFSFSPRKLSVEKFVHHVLNGGAFTVGQFSGTTRTKQTFQAGYMLAMDIDNKEFVPRLNADGSPVIENGVKVKDEVRRTEGYVTYQEVLESSLVKDYALLVYPSPSCTADWHKFRVVFALGEAVFKPEWWETLQRGLMLHCSDWYPDKSCKDSARLYYGSTNRVFEPHINFNAILPLEVAGGFAIDLAIEDNLRYDAPKVDRQPVTGARADAYANAAYDALLNEMGSYESRHDALMSVGTKMFQRMAGGWPVFTETNIERDLYQQCVANGYIGKYGSQEFHRCLNDARQYGVSDPIKLELPDRPLDTIKETKTDLNDAPVDNPPPPTQTPAQPIKPSEGEGLAALASSLREVQKARTNGDVNTDPVTLLKKARQELSALEKIYCPPKVVKFEDAADKAIAELEEALRSPSRVRGLTTDMPDVDDLIGGWRKGWCVVIYGATGMGKSTFCTSVLRTWLRMPGLIIPTEMATTPYMRKIVASVMKIPSSKLEDGDLTEAQGKQAIHLMHKLKRHTSKFLEGGSPTPAEMEVGVKDAVETYGAQWVILDSISKMNLPGMADTRASISYAIDTAQNLAIQYQIPILVTTQVNRDVGKRGGTGKRKKDGEVAHKRPQIQDAAESSQIERNADVILTIYNHNYYVKRGLAQPDPNMPDNTALLTLEKHRHRDAGGLATLLSFVGGSGFYSYAEDDIQF